jgi:hypothetical protein
MEVMENSKPTNEQWAALYEAAAAFKQLAPWKWMVDSELFGVQDPESGEVGYCCVLGSLGEVLGLNVYLGARGLSRYLEMYETEHPEKDPDLPYKQDLLVAHFDDRSFMESEDLKRVKVLGYSFKGDYFFSPAVIQEGGRPYYPQTVIWVHQESGQILAGEFFSHQGFEKAFQDHFMTLIEKLDAVRQEIRVKRIEVLQLLQPVIDYLKIPAALTKELPGLEEARQAMAEFLRRK